MKATNILIVEDDDFSRGVREKLLQSSVIRGMVLSFSFFLFTLFHIHYSGAVELSYVQYRQTFKSDIRRDCLKVLSAVLTEKQFNALSNLRSNFNGEIAGLRRELLIANMEFRQLIMNPKIDPIILFDQQKKILDLQLRLETLSLSYLLKARSLLTDEQLDRLPEDCALGMKGAGLWTNIGIGRAPRRGYRWK